MKYQSLVIFSSPIIFLCASCCICVCQSNAVEVSAFHSEIEANWQLWLYQCNRGCFSLFTTLSSWVRRHGTESATETVRSTLAGTTRGSASLQTLKYCCHFVFHICLIWVRLWHYLTFKSLSVYCFSLKQNKPLTTSASESSDFMALYKSVFNI